MFNIGEENDNRLKNKKSLKDRLVGKKRWILGVILLFGNFCASSMRTHIGVSMVCMVNATAVHEISEKSDIPQFLPERQNSQCHRMQGYICMVNRRASFVIFIWILWKFINNVFSRTTSLMQNYLPTYARDTLDLDLRSNGIFTSIAFICKIVSKYILSFTADYLKSKKILSPTASCKLFQSTASFGVAFMFCIIAFFIDCTRQHLALIVLCFYGIFAGSAIPGYFTSSCSFAPMYTGMVSSLMEVAGAIGNLLAPALVGFFVKQGQTGEWAYVFMSVAAINIITGTVFLFCGSADIQSWAKPQATSKKNLEESSIELVNDNIAFRRNDSK